MACTTARKHSQPVHLLTSLQLGFPAVLLLLLVAVRRAEAAP